MSIFDTNILHPIEELYDQCKEIVERIVPMNMMHYNGSCGDMKSDIERMLKERDLMVKGVRIMKGDVNKISEVRVEYGECIRRIPTYKVSLYYVKEFSSDLWYGGTAIETAAFLTMFTVGISGIINEYIQ